MNEKEFKAMLIRKNTNVSTLSEKIGLNVSTCYRKINDNTFTIKEVNEIVKVLGLTDNDILNIFFH